MKSDSSTKTIVAILAVAAVAIVFWMALLGPKRKEASEVTKNVESAQATLSQTQSTLAQAEEAKREFPKNYRELVNLGQAVPAGDETASLLVQLGGVSEASKVHFESMELGTEEGSEATEETASTGVGGEPIAPTEAEAAVLPLGATIGTAGLGVMPYNLVFTGDYSTVADFIHGIDSLVQTHGTTLDVNGRLMTINGFSLAENPAKGFPYLVANFSVDTFLTPPGQGLTAGASPSGPATEEVTEGTPTASVTK